jgi:hypothetical protein
VKDVDAFTKGDVRRCDIAEISDGNGVTYHNFIFRIVYNRCFWGGKFK